MERGHGISIKDGNKLIAEFMELDPDENELGCFHTEYNYEQAGDEWSNSYLPEDMKYHSSWDWIIPVVIQIKASGFFFFWEDYVIKICRYSDGSGIVSRGAFLKGEEALLTMYDCVVEFLKDRK